MSAMDCLIGYDLNVNKVECIWIEVCHPKCKTLYSMSAVFLGPWALTYVSLFMIYTSKSRPRQGSLRVPSPGLIYLSTMNTKLLTQE